MDLRTIKTRNALFKSLESLLRTKSFEKITVQDICDKAIINRVTFYNHYQDKYELFESYLDYVFEDVISSSTKGKQIDNANDFFKSILYNVTKMLYDNKAIVRSLNNEDNSIIVYLIHNKIYKEMHNMVDTYFKNIEFRYNVDTITTFIIGGFTSLISETIINNKCEFDVFIKESNLLIDDILSIIIKK